MRAANGGLLGWSVAIGSCPGYAVPVAARVRLDYDATVDVSVGGYETRQGLRTAVTLVVADRPGVDPTNVRLMPGDTAVPPQKHFNAFKDAKQGRFAYP
jgi:CO/xanthine dehydrogenase Mo-binding subunit